MTGHGNGSGNGLRGIFGWLSLALALILAATGPRAAAAPFFQGIGDLPGGSFYSDARGVSSDGSVVVGYGVSASGTEAFRWTQAGGEGEAKHQAG